MSVAFEQAFHRVAQVPRALAQVAGIGLREEIPLERWLFDYSNSDNVWKARGYAALSLVEGAFFTTIEAVAWAITKVAEVLNLHPSHSSKRRALVLQAHLRGLFYSAIAIASPASADSQARQDQNIGGNVLNWKWGMVYVGRRDRKWKFESSQYYWRPSRNP